MRYKLSEIPVRVHGRTDGSLEPVALFWTAACVEVNVTGRYLSCEYECDGDINVRVEIDGFDYYRVMLENGRHILPLFRGFSPEKVKNVRIYRENQASNALLAIHAFETDGEFSELPERKLIEFYGDSYTSGEGLAGSPCHTDWIPAVFSCRGGYPLRVASAIGYDHSVVSQSGWGVYVSWDKNTSCAIPRVYGKVCAVASSPRALELGAGKDYTFARKADICVVYLGGNDLSGIQEDGGHSAEGLRKVSEAICGFISKLRETQPEAKLLWAWKDATKVSRELFAGTVARYVAETGDERVADCEIPLNLPSENGARYHPNAVAQGRWADAIIARLHELGWA